jgi:lysophospholipase L1-like esterase
MTRYPALFFCVTLALCAFHANARATGVAALGDSITYGYGNPSLYSWTTALDELMPASYAYTLTKGTSGATLESFVAENTNGVRFYKPSTDIFIIMLGTNNAKPENQAAATANFVANYQAFIDVIMDNNSRNPSVYITTPPPAFANSFTIDPAFVNQNIDAMVTSLHGYRGTTVIDLNDDLMALFSANQSTYLQDGIHPTVAGDQVIAQAIYAAMIPEPAATTALLAGAALACACLRRRARIRCARSGEIIKPVKVGGGG